MSSKRSNSSAFWPFRVGFEDLALPGSFAIEPTVPLTGQSELH